ncbi:MAG: peptidylprolyl isomerase [Clostridia bacterium]|nr:peptidylprolyl isomerase [Clostridia bacterium]
MKLKRILSMILCVAVLACCFAGCSAEGKTETNDDGVEIIDGVVHGEIILELYKDKAPITVKNFCDLANQKFYDGLTFHRIYEGFMIQGGDPDGDGTGGSPNNIKGEFTANGVQNDLSHTRGVISMARSNAMDSASSQFFICHEDSTFLDGQYAAFGKVIEGMEVVDALATVETTYGASGEKTTPVIKQYMKTIEVLEDGDTVAKVKITVGK